MLTVTFGDLQVMAKVPETDKCVCRNEEAGKKEEPSKQDAGAGQGQDAGGQGVLSKIMNAFSY